MDAMQRPGSAAEVIDRLSAAAELPVEGDHDDGAVARSFLAGSQLLGRSAQCQQLQKLVNKTLAGRGAALLVRAEPGMGRSRMLSEAALIAQTAGLTVVRTVARSRGAVASLATDLVQGLMQAAPIESKRASESRPRVAAQTFAAESGEARVQVLSELASFAQEVARARPLLITIDDLDRADEFSSALAAALAFQSGDSPLAVIASYDSQHEAPMLANVPGLATTLELHALSRAHTVQLAASLFGEVPNLERVSDWMYKVAAGNPKLTLQLADYLLARGVVRYAGGMWVLPTELPQDLPPSAAQALVLRLQQVSPEARALAELLCVSRSGASAERILELARLPHASVFGALEELVRAGVLESAGDEYAFAQDAVREKLSESLAPERSRALHTAWAARLLAGRPARAEQLEAGWHLVHTDDALRGADILAEIAPNLVERRIGMAVAVPALERALEVYERHDRPLAQRLHLRSLLVMSSFLFDHRLAHRHAEATLDALYPHTGLALIERLARSIGKPAAFVLGVAATFARWLFLPRRARGPVVFRALKYYARAAMGLVGLRALAFDVQGIRAGFDRMRVFEGAPHPALRLVHALTKAIWLHNQGRGAEIGSLIKRIDDRLSSARMIPMLNHADRTDLLSGVLMLAGINECYRERSSALSYAKRLEQLRTPLAVAAAMRINMIYYLIRGEIERTQHYRRLLDLSAIQNGTVWQIDWIVVPIEGLAGATWSDLIAMRRSLDALEKLAAEVPSFSNMRDTVRIGYHFRRGDHAAAVRFGEQYIAAHPPFTLIGWALIYAQVAFSYLELGQAERALEICEYAQALVGSHHRQYVVQYSTLEAAHATTLAVLGRRVEGERMFDDLVERLRASGEHTRAFLMHEYRVKVARLLGDRVGVLAALRDMREAALASGNPNAILLADSVQNRRTRSRSSPLPPAMLEAQEPDLETASMTRAHETVVTAFLRGEQDDERRAQHALHMLGQYSGGEAYLYWVKQGTLELAASLGQRDPPAGLERLLRALPANDQSEQQTLENFTIVRLLDAASACVGLAALRDTTSDSEIPTALILDIGQALAHASAP
jgi:tetratricopeptide (TPR) repeat protein